MQRVLTRRQFLKGVTSGAVSFPFVLTASASGANARPAPSNRITIGLIGAGALEAVRAALADPDADVCDAAVRALADWPSPAPLDDLLKLAESAPGELHRVLALRGYVRLVARPGSRAVEESLSMYGAALAAADRLEEKKLILAAIGKVPAPEALTFIEPYLLRPAVIGASAPACASPTAHHSQGSRSTPVDRVSGLTFARPGGYLKGWRGAEPSRETTSRSPVRPPLPAAAPCRASRLPVKSTSGHRYMLGGPHGGPA
ncbi:MAG: hypothetical protein JXR37_22210 [Kiritimatiellae bacterium]|nr:hypothetical protein [Kiritimatiellia bacterium]